MERKFPNDFLWGAAASACQIEGAAFEDGKGENKHDWILRDPELKKYYDGTRLPDVCADFYHKYPEDIKLFSALGLNTYRHTVAWSRIFPNDPDEVNPKGLEFYKKLAHALKAAGMEPFFDLLHADIPRWVYERGGLLNPDFIKWFEKYARVCFAALGDTVKLWCTVNEPKLLIYGAYAHSFGPPFVSDEKSALLATKNMLLAHFAAVKAAREICPDAKIGSVHNTGKTYCRSFDERDIHAALLHDKFQHLFLYPMQYGKYPKELLAEPEFRGSLGADDERQIAAAFTPGDFAGLNFYSGCFSRYDPADRYGIGFFDPGLPKDGYGFIFYPQGLYDVLMDYTEMYPGLDLYITENGRTSLRGGEFDEPSEIHNPGRINYIREHLNAACRALYAGARLKGYYHWASMDCFEGGMGFGIDMGLIAINYKTLERIPRDSYYYYQKVIANKGADW